MFSFEPVSDADLDYYEYQIFTNSAGTGTPLNATTATNGEIISGTNKATVFTVSVANSTSSATTSYWGRARVASTSGARGTWSALDGSGDTPLIASQFIQNLTADKIAAGTIGAHTINLDGVNSVIQSLGYQTGISGWRIRGNGDAEFNNLTIRTQLDIGGDDTSSFHVDVDGNMWSGASILNKASAPFRVSNTGVMTATSGTFSGSLSSASGIFTGALSGGTIQIGSGENVFKADSNGIYLGNETFASAEFRVTPAGALTATNANITGIIQASSGDIAGINIFAGKLYSGAGNWNNADTGFYLDLNGYFSLKNKFIWDPNALSGAGQATFTGALSGASGSVTNNFSIGTGCVIGGSLSVGDNVRINNATADNSATVFKVRGNTESNTKWIAKFQNNAPNDILSIRDDGAVSVTGSLSVNGSSVTTGGPYLPTSGGTLSGDLTVNSQMFISASLGTAETSPALRVNRSYDADGGYFIEFTNTAGTVQAGRIRYVLNDSQAVAYLSGSDIRLKNIIDKNIDGISVIKNLNPVHYQWKNGNGSDYFGFIAQELYEVIPNAVSPGDNEDAFYLEDGRVNVEEPWAIEMSGIVPYLVKAIQELSAKVDELESRLV